MGIDEKSWILRALIQDHLFEQGFTDDLMYVQASIGFEGQVLISLAPYAYGCSACDAKGYAPKLADAFQQRIRPTWCKDCVSATDRRWDRSRELTPRLKEVLEQAFTVVEVTPDNPFTSFLVSEADPISTQYQTEAGKRQGTSR